MIVFHHPDSATYGFPGHPERPERVTASAAYLSRAVASLEWQVPSSPAGDEPLLLAHSARHLARLLEPRPFDGDTPYHEGLDHLARLSAGAALEALERARAGHAVFSLMRPPGHHASRERAMGFCYLNNIALTALWARRLGIGRVAIWDFDAHHGNGTEAIVHGKEGILFASVHQFPAYPGTGATSMDNCLNYPVAPDTPAPRHMEVLRRSWEAVLAFEPEILLVSAGFDAYRHDPITTMCLEENDFLQLGCWMNAADLPSVALLEGGYSNDLPRLIAAFLEGWRQG